MLLLQTAQGSFLKCNSDACTGLSKGYLSRKHAFLQHVLQIVLFLNKIFLVSDTGQCTSLILKIHSA